MKARFIAAIVTGLLIPGIAESAEIKLLASAALKGAYLELLPQFEKESGHKVTVTWAGTPDILKRVAAGEAADLVISGSSGTDELIKQGKLVAGSRANFAKSGVGVAVRAKSVAYSAGASGTYIASMFQKMGISDQVKSKRATMKPGEPVGEVVARGDAEIGFQQVSELVPVKGIQYLGPLPAELQNITVFSGGLHSGSQEPDATTALIKFLTAPAAMPAIKEHGLEPG
jgi:molybdate transport system substrate-binding protein